MLGFLPLHDIQGRTSLWDIKPAGLPLNLLVGGLDIGHGYQRPRNSTQAHLCWKQPIDTFPYLCVWNHCSGLYSDTDELLQQGVGYLLDQCVRDGFIETQADLV